MKGRLIVFEGIDCCGKDTQIDKVAEWLRSINKKVIVTHENTNGPIGSRLNELSKNYKMTPEAYAALYTADRVDHVYSKVRPALKQGEIVLCNRYYLSTLAYQFTQGLSFEFLKKMNSFAPKPDLSIIIDISPEESMRRKDGKTAEPTDKEEFENKEFLIKVRSAYKKVKDYLTDHNIIILDGHKSVDALYQEIKDILSSYLLL